MQSTPRKLYGQALCSLMLILASLNAQAALQIQTSQANLRKGPAVTHDVISVVKANEPLKVLAYDSGYVQVERPNGKQGWIHAASQGWSEADIRAELTKKPAAPKQAAPQPAAAAASSARAPLTATGPTSFGMSLADLGYRQGQFFEGAYGIHARDFFFPLPQGTALPRGNLRVYFRASPLLSTASSLRLDINGKPARLLSLENRELPAYVDIPLDAQALDREVLRLTVKASLMHGIDRCDDERRLALYFVQILPQSGLTVEMGTADNLAAAWTALPMQVRVGLPQTLTPAVAASLLQTSVWLRATGRQLSFMPYPQAAEVMVASEAELAKRYPGALANGLAGDGALALARDAQGAQVILVSERPLAQPLSAQPLAGLLRTSGLRFGPAMPQRKNGEVLDLIAAGLGDTQYVSRTVEWNIDLAAPVTPADSRLDGLVLNVVASPLAQRGQLLLQVYLNNMLQEVRSLEQDGKPHTLRFDLDPSLQRAGLNRLRIAVQRAGEEGECKGVMAAYPVQLLPGSRVELEKTKVTPAIFNDLRAYFAAGVDVYLTPDGQANLDRELNQLSSIFANLGLPVDGSRVHLLAAGQAFAPKQPFVLAGGGLSPEKAAVRFDRGRVRVLDGEDQPLLDLDRLPAIGVAQLVSQDGVRGLWSRATREGAMPTSDKLHLDQDDVAFISERGIALTLDSRQPAISRVAYPDYGGWSAWFNRHRFWLIALGWTLIAAAAVTVYRKVRQHGGH